jgi:hypothetical protein
MPIANDFRDEKAELDSLLRSGIFSRSPGLATFLQYICACHFEGKADQIKEYNVAVEAFGRPPDFDQKRDSIVRVEAHRLRKRLQEYYDGPGAGRAIRITIPAGQYAPQFVALNHSGSPDAIISPGLTVIDPGVIPLVKPASLPARPGRNAVRSRQWIMIIAIGVLLAAISWFLVAGGSSVLGTAGGNTTAAIPSAFSSGVADDEVRILAGLQAPRYVDQLGNVWSRDRFFRGGDVMSVTPRTIARTANPDMFLTRREGDFRYDIPLDPGVYELRLYFAETVFGETNIAGGGETSRMFSVSANGKELVRDLDVVADAGGPNAADIKVFTDISPAADGLLHLKFTPSYKEKAFVNAIEILPSQPGKTLPVRIGARALAYTDREGKSWLPDVFYTGGQLVKRVEPIFDLRDPDLYQSERFGNFTYTIPVADGRSYNVTFKFAESWFGEGRPGSGGVGSRVFDVYCNGRTLLRGFDVMKEAGGPLRSVDRTFRGIEPTAQGKLLFQFVPVRNYALINAIEVVERSN